MGKASPEDPVRMRASTESLGSLGPNPVGLVTLLGLLGAGSLWSTQKLQVQLMWQRVPRPGVWVLGS